jgi:tetratricopeptide (TPR) repeat protein
VATISGSAQIYAGTGVGARAIERLAATGIAGGIQAGIGAAGASVLILNVRANTEATIAGGAEITVGAAGPPAERLAGRLVGHRAEPPGQQVGPADRPGPAEQHEEGGLESVVGVDRRAEDAAADGPDHRPVPGDHLLERGLVPVGQELPADRYKYLPALGLFYGIALLFIRSFERGPRARKIVLSALGIVVCALLAQATRRQTLIWHDGLSLWTHSLKWYPGTFLAFKGRGDAYKELGDFEAALADYQRALEIKPDYATVYNNRGNIYSQLKDYSRALDDYSRSIAANPAYAAAYYNRAIVYEQMGFKEKAAMDYLRITVLDPSDAQSRNNLGVLYAKEGRFEEAVRLFSEAIAADHTLTPAYINRSRAIRLLGRI